MPNKENLKKGKQFTSDYQPKPEAISKGMKKKVLLKDIASQLVKGKSKEALNKLAEYLEVDIEQIDIETAMHLKMIEKVLKDGNEKAYNSIMDRLKGKPQQAIDHTTNGKQITPPIKWND